MVELLSPVGDFNCLKAAIQNGADSVYFGADTFNARIFASNFTINDIKKVIIYAKLRGVKTYLTLNTLIKDDEFNQAVALAQKAYEFGIDGIIVQDLGLATKLISLFPDLPIHGSTQMTVHNLNGALKLQELGFKRIVLARELSTNEIDYICKNTKIEIETFIHGAQCISYSGQCLFSSLIGGRSANRGKCAAPCRLPFKLLENDKCINSGYLLSTKDLCGLEYIPTLIESGVKCFKIEGRMKNAEYVATVTRIYRKYIDLALSKDNYEIDENDLKQLMQAFNRGMYSPGHLTNEANRNLVFKETPGNMGLNLGKVQNYNSKKGYITLKLLEPISIGDTISIGNEKKLYTISELMDLKSNNISKTKPGQTVIIGRIKGNITLGDKIYKMSDKKLNNLAKESLSKENRKIALNCKIEIKENKPIKINITSGCNLLMYKDLNFEYTSKAIPEKAINKPLSKEVIINQLSKTNDTPYYFKNIKIDLDDNLFLPKISTLNELRRLSLEAVQDFATNNIHRDPKNIELKNIPFTNKNNKQQQISVLLNTLDSSFDYSKLNDFDNIYIPLKYFLDKKYTEVLILLSQKYNLYIYMPTIVKSNYKNYIFANIENILSNLKVKGFVISNICNLKLLASLSENFTEKFDLIANYTFNIFNTYTINELKKLKINRYTISPELEKDTITYLCNHSNLPNEIILYGKIPLTNMNYCLLGETDKCYPTCEQRCLSNNKYYLQDRMNMKFRILPDNIQTVTTVFNSKTFSISPKDFNANAIRIDILDENIDEINHVLDTIKSGKKLEGTNYTGGNLKRKI